MDRPVAAASYMYRHQCGARINAGSRNARGSEWRTPNYLAGDRFTNNGALSLNVVYTVIP